MPTSVENGDNHAGLDDVFVVALQGAGHGDLRSGDAAVLAVERDDLMAGGLDCAGFVDVDMAGICAKHALPRAKGGGNDDGISLGAADEKMHRGLGAMEQVADELCGVFAMGVKAIAGGLLHIGLNECVKDCGMAAFKVIAVKTKHMLSFLGAERREAASVPEAPPPGPLPKTISLGCL